jgi:cyclopropane-fatty-acyl-phospholipid synthase
MNEQLVSHTGVRRQAPLVAGSKRPRDILGRHLVQRLLEGLGQGRLTVREAGKVLSFGSGAPHVELQVRDPRAWGAFAFGGSIGAGESYMAGQWDCDDVVGLVRLLLRNRQVLEAFDGQLAALAMPLRRLRHWLNRNSRAGSRRNIAAHYDLGNDFYRLWLDPTMMYSCAYFARPDMTLHEASVTKLERICRALDLKAGDHVLEIGTGWGGFALHAAGRYGCRVTTVTLSREQRDLAMERIREAGLGDRIDVQLCDYRDLHGQYDKLVSIEMIEAVGADHLDTYFRQCGRLLKPGGIMFLQAITIADQRYDQALRNVDFIQKHIFPGGFLPSVQALANSVARASDLRVVYLDDIGRHYATTLAAWRGRFTSADAKVRALGFDDRFIRMWRFYLCYCEGGFRERDLGTVQMLLAKPGWRGTTAGMP